MLTVHLTAYDVSGGYPGQVTIKLPAVGIYVGSYRHVPVEVGAAELLLMTWISK